MEADSILRRSVCYGGSIHAGAYAEWIRFHPHLDEIPCVIRLTPTDLLAYTSTELDLTPNRAVSPQGRAFQFKPLDRRV